MEASMSSRRLRRERRERLASGEYERSEGAGGELWPIRPQRMAKRQAPPGAPTFT
jgi:hypothetical protein